MVSAGQCYGFWHFGVRAGYCRQNGFGDRLRVVRPADRRRSWHRGGECEQNASIGLLIVTDLTAVSVCKFPRMGAGGEQQQISAVPAVPDPFMPPAAAEWKSIATR